MAVTKDPGLYGPGFFVGWGGPGSWGMVASQGKGRLDRAGAEAYSYTSFPLPGFRMFVRQQRLSLTEP